MPAGVLAAGLVDLAISLTILIVVVLVYGIVPSVAILMVPLLIVIMIATALGVSAALSALNVRYRDVSYVIPFAIQMWLFISPGRLPQQPDRRALAHDLRDQPDGRRGRRLPLGGARHRQTRPGT